MGYYCVLNQMPERVLMHIEESEIGELFRRLKDPSNRRASLLVLSQYAQTAMADQSPPPISLEKYWRQLHHLLTGEHRPTSSPLSRSIYGGRPFKVRVGDGPARYIWADEVREISSALSSLTHEGRSSPFRAREHEGRLAFCPVQHREG